MQVHRFIYYKNSALTKLLRILITDIEECETPLNKGKRNVLSKDLSMQI